LVSVALTALQMAITSKPLGNLSGINE